MDELSQGSGNESGSGMESASGGSMSFYTTVRAPGVNPSMVGGPMLPLVMNDGHSGIKNELSIKRELTSMDCMSGLGPVMDDGAGSDQGLVNVVRTRRRKAGINEEDRLCVVCGETASGYNFDRLTCESCKAFFRRNAFKMREKIKACSRGGRCDVTGSQRKHCPSCRLEKCFSSGMRKELILPPEKLEQRAKPRRRKHNSMSGGGEDGSPPEMPDNNGVMRSRARHSTLGLHTPFPQRGEGPGLMNLHQPHPNHQRQNMAAMMAGFQRAPPLPGMEQHPRQMPYPPNHYNPSVVGGLPTIDPSNLHHYSRTLAQQSGQHHQLPPSHRQQQQPPPLPPPHTSLGSPDSSCSHSNGVEGGENWSGQSGSSTAANATALLAGMLHQTGTWKNELSDNDKEMFERLSECLRRLREPFSPDDQLQTGAAETLEQAYNRMDTCIRRIIRVAKMIPYFVDIGKEAQIYILKANIYGLIILYSSFFFEKDISKLCYPVKLADGNITRVTVSMLEDLSVTVPVAAFATGLSEQLHCPLTPGNNNIPPRTGGDNGTPTSNGGAGAGGTGDKNSVIREDFELYKRNTLAAFTELQDLANGDDYIRVCMLALKLFSTECLPNQLRHTVDCAQSAYLVFLQRYLTWRLGEAQTARLYPRLLMAFIDIRTLEIRMTGFAKLLCLDGLSPLMREVCSHR